MSVRAYIVYKTTACEGTVTENGEEIDCFINKSYESRESIFNCWYNTRLVELIADNGYDSRNIDGVGEMGIDKDEFFEAFEALSQEELEEIQNNNCGYGAEELNNVIKWFNNHDYMVLNCY